MKLDKEIFSKCSINFNKLVPYGFKKLDDRTFLFSKAIQDGEFKLEIIIDNKGSIHSKIIEVAFDEEFYGLESGAEVDIKIPYYEFYNIDYLESLF